MVSDADGGSGNRTYQGVLCGSGRNAYGDLYLSGGREYQVEKPDSLQSGYMEKRAWRELTTET